MNRHNQGFPQVFAHRGWSSQYPENTMVAFKHALELPIAGLELDLQWTRDQVTVCYHDRSLHKVGGGKVAVRNRTWTNLQHLDVGTWFDPKYAEQRMPLFKDVLDHFGHRAQLFLEVKRREPQSRNRLQGLMANVLQEVEKRGLEKTTAILCFDFELLKWAHEQAPQIPKILNQNHSELLRDDDFLCAYDIRVSNLNGGFVRDVHSRGKKVFSFKVNRDRDLERMRAFGVDGVITDRPDRALALYGACV